jgi:hypothetical protein
VASAHGSRTLAAILAGERSVRWGSRGGERGRKAGGVLAGGSGKGAHDPHSSGWTGQQVGPKGN